MPFEPEDFDLCFCGCSRVEHDPVTGACMFCFPEDCSGFTYDEDATVAALAAIGAYDDSPY